jgi:hypothetical protein
LCVGVALLAGAALAYYAIVTRPLSWPRTEARVVSSRVVNPVNPAQHQPEIVFELNARDGVRRVTTVSSWNSSSYGAVRAYVDSYPPGARVEVAVNPADADDVRHELGATLTNLILPGALAVLGAVFALVAAVSTLWREQPTSTDQSPQTLRLVAGLFVAVGVACAAAGAWQWSAGTAADWPEVEATVVDSAVIQVANSSSSPSRPAFDVQVTFRYDANGAVVTSRTTSGQVSWGRTAAEARMRAYPPGSRQRVRHRPDDGNVVRFEVSALRERALAGALLLMGLVFVGFGVMTRTLTRRPARLTRQRARQWG